MCSWPSWESILAPLDFVHHSLRTPPCQLLNSHTFSFYLIGFFYSEANVKELAAQPGIDPRLQTSSTTTALPQHHHSATTAPPQRHHSTTTAPPQHHHSTTTAPPQHHHSTTTAPPQHHHSTTTAPPQHHHSTTTAPPQHHHSTVTFLFLPNPSSFTLEPTYFMVI